MEKIPTLQDIPKEKWRVLKYAIKNANGRVLVFVHPFYYDSVDEVKVSEKLMQKSKVPFIVLEEHNLCRKRVQELKTSKSFHIVLPTEEDNPKLIERIGKRGQPVLAGYVELRRILMSAGAKRVFVGGMESSFARDSKVFRHEKKRLPKLRVPYDLSVAGGCAGFVYADLIKSGKFEVRLIPGTLFPAKPQYERASSVPRLKPRKRRIPKRRL